MRRAGFLETRSYPPLQILLKPTTLDAGARLHGVLQPFIASASNFLFLNQVFSGSVFHYLSLKPFHSQ